MITKIVFGAFFLFAFQMSLAYIEVEFNRIEQISGWNFSDMSSLKVKRINKTTRGIFGKLVQHVAADDTYLASFETYLKQGGEYRKLPFKLPPKGFCSFINEDIYIYPELSKASDIPWPMPCPLPIKTFTVNGFIPSVKNLPILLMMSGDYMIESVIVKDRMIVNSFRTYASLINLDRT